MTSAPPPINPNYTVPNYVVADFVSQFESVNFRNQRAAFFTLTSSQLEAYILGVLIVPIILLAVFFIWWLFICVILCVFTFRVDSKRDICCWKYEKLIRYKEYLWCIQIILLFGTFATWCICLGFAISSHEVNSAIQQSLNQGLDSAANVVYYMNLLQNYTAQAQNQTYNISISCSSSPSPQLIQAFNTATENLASAVVTVVPPVASALSDTLSSVESSLYILKDLLLIRELLLIILASVELLSTILLVFLLFRRKKSASLPTRRCCTCEFALFNIQVLIAVIMAILTHSVALIEADVCFPDVNTNLGKIFMEALNLNENLNCSDQTTMSSSPFGLQAFCYYQTCSSYFDLVSKAELVHSNLTEAFITMNQTIEEVQANTTCLLSLNETYQVTDAAKLALGWLFYFLSCPNLNTLYSQLVYYNFCHTEVYNLINTFNSWLAATILLFCAETFWIYTQYIILSRPNDLGDDIKSNSSTSAQANESLLGASMILNTSNETTRFEPNEVLEIKKNDHENTSINWMLAKT